MTALFILGAITVVPTASASVPACKNSATATAGPVHVIAGGIRTSVWQESNGLSGLQTQPCKSGGTTYPKDQFVGQAVPQDLGILGICAGAYVIYQCF